MARLGSHSSRKCLRKSANSSSGYAFGQTQRPPAAAILMPPRALARERGGILMLAEIAMRQALAHGSQCQHRRLVASEPRLIGSSDNVASYCHGMPRVHEGGCFREVAMDQVYLTLTVSGLTLLVGAYVLGVVALV